MVIFAASLGKRSWKLFYARLRDLVLYLYKDAETAAAATRAEEMHLSYVQQVHRMHFQYQQELRYHHDIQQAYAAAALAQAASAALPQTNGRSAKQDEDEKPTAEEEMEKDEGFDVDDEDEEVTQEATK